MNRLWENEVFLQSLRFGLHFFYVPYTVIMYDNTRDKKNGKNRIHNISDINLLWRHNQGHNKKEIYLPIANPVMITNMTKVTNMHEKWLHLLPIRFIMNSPMNTEGNSVKAIKAKLINWFPPRFSTFNCPPMYKKSLTVLRRLTFHLKFCVLVVAEIKVEQDGGKL